MALHRCRSGRLFLLAWLLVGSNLAVEANAQSRSGSSAARANVAAQQWANGGAWHAIEDQIRKPIEQPAMRLADLPALRGNAAANADQAVEANPLRYRDDSDAIEPAAPSDSAEVDGSSGEPDAAIPPELTALRDKIRSVLARYQTRQLNTRDHTPWEVMHAFVAFNTATEIRRDGPGGPPVNAIEWILAGGRCRGHQLLTLQRGRPYAQEGVGVQGHPAQLLAILAQSGVEPDVPMRLGGKDFVLRDLIDEELLDCRANSELTFKLISFAHYLPSEATWRSRDGQAWSIPRLINAEIKAPIRGAACGGTHRLFGITYAYKKRQQEGLPLEGEFMRARQYITSYQQYAWSLQNPDGSFSTEWFARRGNRPDIDRKIQTSGHILEWLVFSLDDEQLRDPRTVKAVDFVASSLAAEPHRPWSIGPLGHALHALVMYDERLFGERTPQPGSNSLAAEHSGLAKPAGGPWLGPMFPD